MSDWPAMMDSSRGPGDNEEEKEGRGRWDLSVAAGRAHFQRMLEAAGPLHVEISKDGPTFYGDERFGEETKMTSRGFAQLVEEELLIRQSAPKVEEEARHLYLNQCPLYPPPSPSVAAPSLLDDILLPSFLLPCLRHPSPTSPSSTSSSSSSSSRATSIPFPWPAEAPSLLPALHSANLWVSAGGTSSNVHYDCFPNLLCVVHGSKRVALWPPAATPHLCPHPVYGKATNHSRLHVHEDGTVEGAESLPRPMVAVVRSGQMLFIPEGWYHQVTSPAPAEDDDPLRLVVAVNIWWKSEFDLLLEASTRRRPTAQRENGDHGDDDDDDDDGDYDPGMEIYYARRLMETLTRGEMQRMMTNASSDDDDLDTDNGRSTWRKRKRADDDDDDDDDDEEECGRKKAKKDEGSSDDVVDPDQPEETRREEVEPDTATLAGLLRRGSDPAGRAALVGEMARRLTDSAQLCGNDSPQQQQQRQRRDLRAWLRACDGPMMRDCLEAAMDSSPPALAAFIRSLSVVDARLLLERLQQDDDRNNGDDGDDDAEGTRRERWWLRFAAVMRPHGSLAELLRKEQSLHELAFSRAIAHALATNTQT